jgi:hypothetical protein
VFLNNARKPMTYIKLLAAFLMLFKIGEYIYTNIKSDFSYPIEISTITYFMFSIIVIFNIKKAYHIASFFAIISGLGFFLYYSTLGFISSFYFDLPRHIIAIFSHGILFIGGVYLLEEFYFDRNKRFDIYIIILAIICHASIFYFDAIKGTTFIYFIVKPDFLEQSSINWINHLIKLSYYSLMLLLFNKCIDLFYRYNNRIICNKGTVNVKTDGHRA